MIDDGELAERLEAVGVGVVRPQRRRLFVRRLVREGLRLRRQLRQPRVRRTAAGDHRRQVAVHQLAVPAHPLVDRLPGQRLAAHHVEDRQVRARIAGRVERLVVHHRQAARRAARAVQRVGEHGVGARHAEVLLVHLATIELRLPVLVEAPPARLDVDRAEEPLGERAAVAAAGKRRPVVGGVVEQVGALVLGEELGGRGRSRRHQARAVGADVRGIVLRPLHPVEPLHVHPGDPGRGLRQPRRRGSRDRLRVQQVGEVDLQAVPLVGAQHQRPRPLEGQGRSIGIGTQLDVPGIADPLAGRNERLREPAAVQLGVVGGRRVIREDVAGQGVDHAARHVRPEAVQVQDLVHRDHIGGERGAGRRRGGLIGRGGGDEEQRQKGEQDHRDAEEGSSAIHTFLP